MKKRGRCRREKCQRFLPDLWTLFTHLARDYIYWYCWGDKKSAPKLHTSVPAAAATGCLVVVVVVVAACHLLFGRNLRSVLFKLPVDWRLFCPLEKRCKGEGGGGGGML